MSYCRWSSDNWRCDLYCFGSGADEFTTHVASNRVVGEIPQEPDWALLQTDAPEFMRQHNAVMGFLKTAERKPIGLPHDGESFHDSGLANLHARVQMLKDVGYNVPDGLLEEIQEEIDEAVA